MVCSVCGSAGPELFALVQAGKMPICKRDIGSLIEAHGGLRSSTILPISAFDIVETVADLQVYDENIGKMDVGSRKVERLLAVEADQFEKANLALLKMKEDAISLIDIRFDKLLQRFKNFHQVVIEELASSRKQITTLRRRSFSRVTEEILRDNSEKEPNFYMELITDVTKKMEKLVDEVLLLEYSSGEDFMLEVLRPDSLESLDTDLCSSENQPPEHPNTSSLTISPQKSPLLRIIPAVEPTPRKCIKCTTECRRQFHSCRDDAMCLECYERLIATECYSKKAECPMCGKLPAELYDIREKKKCSMCKYRLKLNEIAHWCPGSDCCICDACYPKIYADGKCVKCGQMILPPPR